MDSQLRLRRGIVVGGGIAGLAAALALGRSGSGVLQSLTLLERSPRFEEVGAGLQLGPNANRLLIGLGLGDGLARIASEPTSLTVCSATRNHTIAVKPLGQHSKDQYGAPYYTLHRADLHALLLDAVQTEGWAQLVLNRQVSGIESQPDQTLRVTATNANGQTTESMDADLLLGCDGGFSAVRALMLADGPPQATGQVAFRALLPQKDLRLGSTAHCVTAWLGPDMHAVGYPIRAGELYNLVVILQVPVAQIDEQWEQRRITSALPLRSPIGHKGLAELVASVEQWRSWALFDRAPVSHVKELAPHPGVVLLGDAAHPMLPFLAQGAAMAIEDACAIARFGSTLPAGSVADQRQTLAQRYTHERLARVAKVQSGARRNAKIFHASGATAVARDWALKLKGQTLLDRPWLYGYAPPTAQ